MYFKLFSMMLIVAFGSSAFPQSAFSDTEFDCPSAPANKWRSELSPDAITKEVMGPYDGNWSAYIAHWERLIDLARDVENRRNQKLVWYGKDKAPLPGEELDQYADSMQQRVETAYCLAARAETTNSIPSDQDQVQNLAPEMTIERQRIGRKLALKIGCQKCHGETGIAVKPNVPHIAGQTLGYLANQLRAFRKKEILNSALYGRALRKHKAMRQVTHEMTPVDRLNIAVYFAAQKCHNGAPGNSSPKTPQYVVACLNCHGAVNKAVSSVIPHLGGQNRDYLITELRAFRLTKGNSRAFKWSTARYHQYMSPIARQMTNKDIENVAKWFSAKSCVDHQLGD